MLVHEFLERSTIRFPEKTALVSGTRRMTYRELDEAANRLATALKRSGVGYGDRVVALLENSPETVISIFGILKSGAIFVVVNPTTKQGKLVYILDNCRARAFITHRDRWKSLGAAAAGAPSLQTVILVDGKTSSGPAQHVYGWTETLESQPPTRPPGTAIDIDLAALIYTSGTTGNPKGVMLTHRNMVAASTSITTYLENTENDIILDVLPL